MFNSIQNIEMPCKMNRTMFGNKIVSAVTWISLSIKLWFCVDDEKETPGKP